MESQPERKRLGVRERTRLFAGVSSSALSIFSIIQETSYVPFMFSQDDGVKVHGRRPFAKGKEVIKEVIKGDSRPLVLFSQ